MTDNPARRCTARSTRTGQQCKNAPIPGGTVCRFHGGSAPQVRRAAEQRAAVMAAHEAAQRMVARAGVDADPIEHLLESLHRAAALVEVYGQMVADLDNASEVELSDQPGRLRGEVWVELKEVEKADGGTRLVPEWHADRLLALTREGMAKPHPFVTLYHEALERRARFAKLAIDAGVAERQVRLAEQHAQLIAQVLRGVLTDLGVMDHPDAPAVIRRHLQIVAG